MSFFGIGSDASKQQASEAARSSEEQRRTELLSQALQSVTQLSGQISAIQQQVTNLEQRSNDPLKQAPIEPTGPTPDTVRQRKRLQDLTPDEFESMPAYERHLMHYEQNLESLESMLDKRLKPLSDQLSNVRMETSTDRSRSEIERLRTEAGPDGRPKRADFDEWLPEMRELAKSRQGLGVEDLYLLAKSRNPEKADQIKGKYWPKDDGPRNELIDFGGLLPDPMQRTSDGGDLSIDDAAGQAWQEFSRTHGGLEPPTRTDGQSGALN